MGTHPGQACAPSSLLWSQDKFLLFEGGSRSGRTEPLAAPISVKTEARALEWMLTVITVSKTVSQIWDLFGKAEGGTSFAF